MQLQQPTMYLRALMSQVIYLSTQLIQRMYIQQQSIFIALAFDRDLHTDLLSGEISEKIETALLQMQKYMLEQSFTH